jgi:hypothetical protein
MGKESKMSMIDPAHFRPPTHPGWGDDCGPDPCKDMNWAQVCRSWNEIQCLKQVIQQVLDEMGIVAPTPPSTGGGGGTSPGPPITNAITGVTDGSNPAPGIVGEFISQSQPVPVTNAATVSYLTVPVSIPAGDWDVEASILTEYLDYEGLKFNLTPIPPGMSADELAWSHPAANPGTGAWGLTAVAPRARASFAAATPLAFTVLFTTLSLVTGPTATPQFTFTVTARRMR